VMNLLLPWWICSCRGTCGPPYSCANEQWNITTTTCTPTNRKYKHWLECHNGYQIHIFQSNFC
jgi:hypothetical protein